MKKTNTRLLLKKHTIRMLQDNELANVVGGGNTNKCTNVAQTCKVGLDDTLQAAGR